ncbi:MAG: YraN family protein [Planctomycetota bacterium]
MTKTHDLADRPSPLHRRLLDRLRESYLAVRFGVIDQHADLGRRGEQAAARMLRRKNLHLISHSESDRQGEIDLIAMDRRTRTLVFVEVKTLASTKPGHPAERVDENKQRRITRAALRYLRRQHLVGCPCRFDVVAVWWASGGPRPDRIEHYESAFEAVGDWQFYA